MPKAAYLWLAAIAVAAFLLFLPAVNNGFINWDDSVYYFANPNLAKIDSAFFKWIFFTVDPGIANWIPLTLFTHAIDLMVWGPDPWGPHLVNIFVHSANTFLVGLVSLRLLYSVRPLSDAGAKAVAVAAVFTALIFGIHPLRVESVVWVSERKDLLCAFFFLLSLNSYISFTSDRKGKNRSYALSLAFALLSLLSKPMSVSLPFVLLIMDFYPLERFSKGRPDFKRPLSILIEKLPFFALSAGVSLAAIWAQSSSRAVSAVEAYPGSMRLWMSLKGYAFYLYKTVWPLRLSTFYPHPAVIDPSSFEFAASAALFILITVFCAIMVKRHKAYLAAWMYYLITLLPVIGIVKVGAHSVADRYTYIPLIAPVLLAGAFFGKAYSLAKWKAFSTVLLAIAALTLGYLTYAQSALWKDSVTFWSRAIELYPGASTLPYLNRALAYDDAGMYDEAIRDYDTALALNPGNPEAYNNRALVKASKGAYMEAVADYDRALAIDPGYAVSYNNRGLAYMSIKETQKAIDDFKRAIELDRGMTIAYDNLARAYEETGEISKAIEAAGGRVPD